MKKINYFLLKIVLVGVIIFSVQACNKEEDNDPTPPETHEQGDISKTTSLGTYTPNDIQQIFDAANVEVLFNLEYNVKVLSVNYYTVDGNDNQIVTSGAFFIPQNAANLPLLCTPHGTETKRNKVASVAPTNSTEGIIGLMTASMGYYTIAPDYPGFGVSDIIHPYFHAESLVPSVIDFMKAGKSYAMENQITLDGHEFLTGYSEGGYISLATQKTIEENYADEFNLTAVAPLAGPYDLKGMIDTIFLSGNNYTSAYSAYFLNAYNEIYNWNRLDEIFNVNYTSIIPGLFDGSKTWGEINNQLPATSSDILNSDFVSNYNNGSEPEVIAAIQENTFLDWTPQSPIHFFHGDADSIVPLQNALTAIDVFTQNGAVNIQLTTIPGGTHETAGPDAIFGAIGWFENF
ncbi:MAG: hypothetical protein K8R53_09575 [Bacteroidales bacterium]|nr:hypothetical protein [Bacteroidales bacterium]